MILKIDIGEPFPLPLISAAEKLDMSVTTTADEKLDEARKHLRIAIENLSEIVINKVWGSKDFLPEYQNGLQEALVEMLDTERKISG